MEVLSGSGPGTGREVLRRLAQIRHVIETRTGTQNLTPLPVQVLVFPSARAFSPYQIRDNAAGYFASGVDRDYIVMRSDASDLYRVVFHEFVHLVLHRAGTEAPVWFNEGTAEVYSTAHAGARDVRIGAPIASHIATLQTQPLLPLTELFSVTESSRFYTEREKMGIFYAESWALLHMLNFGTRYRPNMPRFVDLLLSGTASDEALTQAFGFSVTGIQADLGAYIRNGIYDTIQLPASRPDVVAKAEAEPLTDTEVKLAQADLLLAIHRPDSAEAVLRSAETNHYAEPALEAALGEIALERKQDAIALEHFRRAMTLGSRSARLRLDYALVLRELNAPARDVATALEEALSLDPHLRQARELLETTQLRLNQAQQAVSLRPQPATEEAALRAPALEKLEGVLTQVDCLDIRARLHVLSESRRHFLLVRDPRSVMLRNAGGASAELACGPAAGGGRPVVIEFRREVNATLGTAGEVAAIDFR